MHARAAAAADSSGSSDAMAAAARSDSSTTAGAGATSEAVAARIAADALLDGGNTTGGSTDGSPGWGDPPPKVGLKTIILAPVVLGEATPIALAGPRRHTITGSLSSLSAHQYFPTESSNNNNSSSSHNSSSNHSSNITAAALNALESLGHMPHADAVTEAHVVADVITDVLPRP
eukprot:11539-Heterococcus_DN1.PRE.1